MDKLTTALIALNGAKANNGNTDEQVKSIRDLISQENTRRAKSHAKDTVSIMKDSDVTMGLSSFVDNQFFKAIALSFSEDENEYKFKDVKKQLCFKTVAATASEEKFKIVDDNFSSYMSLFLHNIYLYEYDETKLNKETRSKLSISEQLQNVAKHNAEGIFLGNSKNKLMSQLEQLYSMIIPDIKPLKADLRFCIMSSLSRQSF